ncbi:hypothetical protein FRC09_014505 [Ceratobasidium sp. 395]|nr:hypothetical protein FRC09_014505 [Ceratobasidium sp. 395]
MSSAPDGHRTMIGLPATYRPGQQRAQPPPEEEYNAYMAQMRASGIPSSTMPSAAHSARSLEQHPNAQTLNNENPHFGVFEPQIAPRSYSSFAPLLGSDQAQGQNGQQQQVPGEFVPGGGGGIYRRNAGARPHPQVLTQSIHDVSRSNTTMSGYSDPSSSANMSSPVRPSASGYAHQQPYASPPDFGPAGFSFPQTGRSLEYPSSGSDPFPGSEQYTSPSPANYMSSPEMIQPGHFGQQQQQQQTRPMANIFNATSPPYTSPTRPGPAPYIASGDQAWQPTTGLAPSSSLVPISGNGSSGGSHSSGGGGGTGGAYAGSSGGYSTGSNPAAQQRPTVGLSGGPGRSRSVGGGNATRYQHTHSQSGDGLLAPPRPNKRPHIAPEEDEESSEEEPRQGTRGGQQNATKRL